MPESRCVAAGLLRRHAPRNDQIDETDQKDQIDQMDGIDERPPHLDPLPPGERKIKDGVFTGRDRPDRLNGPDRRDRRNRRNQRANEINESRPDRHVIHSRSKWSQPRRPLNSRGFPLESNTAGEGADRNSPSLVRGSSLNGQSRQRSSSFSFGTAKRSS